MKFVSGFVSIELNVIISPTTMSDISLLKQTLRQFSQLIDLLYQAPLHPKGFQPFLEQFVVTFSLADATIYVQESQTQDVESAWIAGPKAAALIEFVQLDLGAGNYVPEFLAANPRGHFYSLQQHFGRWEDERLNEVQLKVSQWYDRHHFVDVASCIIEQNSETACIMSMHRCQDAGHLSERELLMMDLLVPHIQKAFALYQQLAGERFSKAEVRQLLSHISHATLLYDSKTQLVGCNQQAIELCEIFDELELTEQGFRLTNTLQQHDFLGAIFDVVYRPSQWQERPFILTVRHQSPELQLIIYPTAHNDRPTMQNDDSSSTKAEIGAMVYLYDRQQRRLLDEPLLNELFGLSEREIEVCQLLLSGYNRNEIAAVTELSAHTIKDHIKSVFAKTQSHSQAELILTLLNSPASPP